MKIHLSDGSLPLFRFRLTSYEKGVLQPIMTGRVLLGIILYFFGPWRPNCTKHDPFGGFFHFFLDSLNMNDAKLTFNGLIKLNTERPSFGNEPLLSQVHKTHENGLLFRRATTSVFYLLWTRKNKKRHSSNMMGKLREGNQFIFQIKW